MKKTKYYYKTRFSARVIEDGHDLFLSLSKAKDNDTTPRDLVAWRGGETWNYDSREEFLAEVVTCDRFMLLHYHHDMCFEVTGLSDRYCEVAVRFPGRPQIESVFQVFKRHLDESRIATQTSPVSVFIGHGRDSQWRDLKDHLHEQHGLDVTAYEIGPRAGLSVKDVLEKTLKESSFALLVLTGEDTHADGEVHARENVIHEVGLFHGKLGFQRAIVLLENGVKEFSNILGVNQIRFGKGRIRETFGDVIATIKREFED